MKKIVSALIVLLFGLTAVAQNAATRLTGKLVSEDNAPIAGATITLGNQNLSTTTNENGEFTLIYLEAGDEEVIVEADGYISTIELVNIKDGLTSEMGDIVLQEDIAKEAQEEILLNLSEEEMNDDEGKSQAQASASSASQDVFNNITSFAWSSARYRNRGLDQRYEQNYINGVNFNSAERGTFNFSAMGGLNDASRNKEVMNAIEANNFTFGSMGHSTNYLMNASRFAQGWKIGVAGTNRNYKAAVRATYASGMFQNGWSFVAQLAFRFSPYTNAKNQIGEGSDYWSFGAFFAAEKVFKDQSRLNLVALLAPTSRGQNSALTQEAVDLTGSTYYNPYWGWQDGKMRNSRIVKSFDPTVVATYEWTAKENHKFKVGLGYHYSQYSNSALNFYNAPDPRPDYYRNMPSYMWDGQIGSDGNWITKDMNGVSLGNMQTAINGQLVGPSVDINNYNRLVKSWQDRDDNTTQINWDNLYAANLANNYNNPNGCARYIQERRHNDIQELSGNFNYVYDGIEHLKMTTGVDLKYSDGIHYKTIDDLLGANQWIDLDPFAERDIKDLATNLDMTQNQIENVKKNDMAYDYDNVLDNYNSLRNKHFGYDYHIHMTNAKAWYQNEWTFNEIDFYYAAQLSVSSMQRNTNMVNGRAWYLSQVNPDMALRYLGPDAQKILDQHAHGTLKHQMWKGYAHTFVDPSLKLGLTYKINGRNRLKVNAIAQTQAPLARDAYVSARVHDRVINNIYRHDYAASYAKLNGTNVLKEYYAASEKQVGADLTYEFNFPVIRGRITGFYNQIWDGTQMNGYYDDEVNTFVNQVLSGLNSRHFGLEAAAAIKCGTYFTLTPAISIGDYRYTSNAEAITSAENGMAMGMDNKGNSVYETRDSIYMKGVRISNGPQLNTSLKISFFHPKMWFFDVTLSYYDWNYLSVAPSRRAYGLYSGIRVDKSVVNGSLANMRQKDENGNIVTDKYGTPIMTSPYNQLVEQEKLTSSKIGERFLLDASIGKLIYLPNRQSLSINLSVSNMTNNTGFKTGGYQQARIARNTIQGEEDETKNKVISPNVWKFPAKYYYAWGTNFYLTMTYKF